MLVPKQKTRIFLKQVEPFLFHLKVHLTCLMIFFSAAQNTGQCKLTGIHPSRVDVTSSNTEANVAGTELRTRLD
jgi:hypothetical protein